MPLHVLVLAEPGSHLRWASGLVDQLPEDVRSRGLLTRSSASGPPTDREGPVADTSFAGQVLEVVSPSALAHRVEGDRPDAVLLACSIPVAHAYVEVLRRARRRPVLVSGTPGIALPARRQMWGYRGAVDLLVVHSRREAAEYEVLRGPTSKRGRIVLASLPCVAGRLGSPGRPPREPLAAGGPTAREVGRPGDLLLPGRRVVVFAAQTGVPRSRRHRVEILRALDRLALARPELDIVVQAREEPGGSRTPYAAHHYRDLLRGMRAAGHLRRPERLRVSGEPVPELLGGAAALATVSSVAALEAMARGIPVLLLEGLGARGTPAEEVFLDSGCLAGLDALAVGDFRHPLRRWSLDNYFHPPWENTWVRGLLDLAAQAGGHRVPGPTGGPGPRARPGRRQRWLATPGGQEGDRALGWPPEGPAGPPGPRPEREWRRPSVSAPRAGWQP